MAKQQRFTEAQVEYLVRAKKYIFAIPDIEQEEGGWSVMQAEVKKNADPNYRVPAFEAAPLIKPPASRGVSDYQ